MKETETSAFAARYDDDDDDDDDDDMLRHDELWRDLIHVYIYV